MKHEPMSRSSLVIYWPRGTGAGLGHHVPVDCGPVNRTRASSRETLGESASLVAVGFRVGRPVVLGRAASGDIENTLERRIDGRIVSCWRLASGMAEASARPCRLLSTAAHRLDTQEFVG
jgi:hypothetical protein